MDRIIVLKGEELSLVKPCEQDLDFLFNIKNDPVISQYLWSKSEYTRKDIEYYYDKNIRWNQNYFAIMNNLDFKIVWFVWLKTFSRENNNWSLVIFLSSWNVGKWYWFKSMRLFMKYCFEVINLHKLKLQVYSNNSPAIGLYKKLWFKEVWILSEEVLFNNVYIDKICMEIFKTEYVSI